MRAAGDPLVRPPFTLSCRRWQLLQGTAECYGSEMAPRHKYTIAAGSKLAIFTYQGCYLEINGKARVAYVGKDTPMIIYSNIHNKLQEMRAQAAASATAKGPRVRDSSPSSSVSITHTYTYTYKND